MAESDFEPMAAVRILKFALEKYLKRSHPVVMVWIFDIE